VLSIRQVVEIVCDALGHEMELISMPFELALPAHPLVAQPSPTYRVLDTSLLRERLGYCDLVPAREAVARTARWLAANPIEPGAPEEYVLTDPFDYPAEDLLMDAWAAALSTIPEPEFIGRQPGVGLAYSGPGGRRRTQPTFEQ
jgi:hypothetical protein